MMIELKQNEATWQLVREALERVMSGAVKRVDLETEIVKVSVYRTGQSMVRCDINNMR